MAPVNPLDPALFDKVASKLTYAKLYPLIMADFMGKGDCKAVHMAGNMIVNTTGGPTSQSGPVTHTVAQGGSDSIAQGKKAAYEAALKVGGVLEAVTGA